MLGVAWRSNCGVSLNKNELGYVCMIFGLFFFWNLLQGFKIKNRKARRNEMILSVVFLGLTGGFLSCHPVRLH